MVTLEGSRSGLQQMWERILSYTGDDPYNLYVYGSIAILVIVYWAVGLLYTILDVFNRPAALKRYKIQPGTNAPIDNRKLLQVVLVVLFNQLVVTFIPAILCYKIAQWKGFSPIHELPHSFTTISLQLIGCLLIEEAGLYYNHRLLHHPKLYKHFHKMHHSWTAPIAIEALYAHPLEYVLCDVGPPFFGAVIMGCHISVAWLWFSLAVIFTLNGHCGYHIPFLTSPEMHDYHHQQFNCCFGTLGILDKLHGTDGSFRNSKNRERHYILTGLKSARELHPDDKKKNT